MLKVYPILYVINQFLMNFIRVLNGAFNVTQTMRHLLSMPPQDMPVPTILFKGHAYPARIIYCKN